MKMLSCLLLGLLLAGAAPAQGPLDSLTAALRYNPRSDMGRVRPAAALARPTAPPSDLRGQAAADSTLAAARHRGDRPAEIEARLNLYDLYMVQSRLALALAQLHRVQALLAQTGNRARLAWALRVEGLDCYDQGSYERALELYQRALALLPASQTGQLARIHALLSLTFGMLGDEAEAAHHEQLSAHLLPRVNPTYRTTLPDTCADVLSLLGASNLNRQHWTVSQYYYQRAIAQARQANHLELLPTMFANLAYTYTYQNQPRPALRCMRPYLAALLRNPDSLKFNAMRLALAVGYYENHQPDSARLHGQVALSLARRARDKNVAYWACWALAGAAAEQQDYARAWHYQHLGTVYQDSMHVEESGRRQAFARHNVTLARQQARIALLTKDRELARLRQQRLAISLVLLAVLLLGGGGAAGYLVRQRQRRREAALRQRLAADLHDEVGSLLTRLSLESSLLREGLTTPQEQQRQLESLVSVSQQAQRQLRDVVWSIRPDFDTLPHLLDQLREHGYDLLGAAGLEFDFQTEAGVAEAALPALARPHLYLIYKEALHNAVKHARGASTVCVRLTLAGPALCLSVRDDGAGSAAAPGHLAGSGLANMRQRAEAVGGTVAYDTAPGRGFAVRVLLPLAGQRLPQPHTPAGAAARAA